MTKLSTWCLYLCLCPAMFRSVRAQASYWERTDCGPNALTTQDFVSCLLSEPDCVRDCDIFFTSSGESCEEEKAEMCFLYQACCPACDAQYQQWFGMCGNLVARHGNNCICPKTAPVAPPPSVNEVFTTPPRPTPMPVTRSPTTTFCDEMKIDYSMCRIQNYRECGDCEKPTNFSAFSSCDLAKDDLCTHNSGCCDECEKQYLDWINQCTLPLFGSDCRCENWSPPTPPTDAPTSEPLRIDLNPWPDDFQISAEPGTYVVTKASLDLESLDFDDAPPEFYQELVFGIQSNVPTTLYYHKKMYLHGHPLHPPFLEEAEDLRCDPWSSRTFANIAVISDCELQPDIQVEIGGRRDVLKFSITSTEMSNNTVFFEPSTFSGRWSCPKGKPIYCTSASINLSFFWTAFLVFLSTAASIVAPLPFLSQNRRIWWGACTGIVVWTASTQTKIFSKALSTSSEKMCNVNLEIITNACLGLYESSGIEVSENVRIYEITESGLELYQDRICSSGFPVSSSPVDGVEVDACNDCGYCPTGRPFRDYKDKIVLAASQNADASSKSAWSTDPQLPHDQYGTRSTSASLSEEWTHRAIGEHASIASFASFVIALMANQAPPHLIQRALLAAMDELNHATISFTVASILLGDGTNIEPGPLPPSTLTFSKNLTALGIATAREGCTLLFNPKAYSPNTRVMLFSSSLFRFTNK